MKNFHPKNNNLKTITKNKKNTIVNKEQVNKEEIMNKLISEYRQKGLSKDLCLRVLSEVEENPGVENFGAYLRTCLENTLYKKMLKNGEIEFKTNNESIKRSEFAVSLYNWLDE